MFQQKNYLENFVQATFNALDEEGIKYTGGALVVSGDGRYWMKHAIQVIVRIALANGVKEVIVGVDGLMSTPAVSAVVRRLRSPEGALPFGAFILTASHNPGGPENDFGIKYNGGNGAPAPESLTAKITDHTKTLKQYRIAENEVTYDLSKPGLKRIGGGRNLVVIDAAALYVELMEGIFDFEALRAFVQRKDFSMVYDGMHGVAGPFAKAIFVDKLGLDDSVLQNCEPKQDFGGGHPDPNLTYAKDLVEKMLKLDGHDLTEDDVGLRHQLSAGAVHLVCPHTLLRIEALAPDTQLFRAAAKPYDDDIEGLGTGLTLA